MASPSVAHRFLQQLAQAADDVRKHLFAVYGEYGLSEGWFDLLQAVATFGETGCSQTQLATRLGLAESSVCTHVDRLQQEGLLHRFRSKQDRRRSLLLLSAEGRTRLDDAASAVDHALTRWLDASTDEEIERVSDWLASLLCTAAARSNSSAARNPRLREAG
ncbi:MAG: MarR family transcriptional regulator [Planctomycetaceae bacterium]|nr:MarR family transcriptional regulator [Planctomycetaceae bacterium]